MSERRDIGPPTPATAGGTITAGANSVSVSDSDSDSDSDSVSVIAGCRLPVAGPRSPVPFTLTLTLALALTLTTTLAHSAPPPPPLATAQLDLDGDGRPEPITLDPDGRLHVAAAEIRLDAPAHRLVGARLTGAPVEGHALLLVEAQLAAEPGLAGELYEWRHTTLTRLWTGRLGALDPDAESQARLTLTPDGVLLWQERADISDCDGRPERLFPQRFDLAASRFRPAPAPTAPSLPAGTPRLAASRDAAPPTGLSDTSRPTVFRFHTATTTADDGGTADGLGPPRELDDGDPRTAWAEAPGATGRGAALTARAQAGRGRVVALRLIPGDAASPAAFKAANRIRRLLLTVGARSFSVDLAVDPAALAASFDRPYWIVLPEPIPATCVRAVVDDVYPGAAAKKRTAIAELVVLTDLDAGGDAALADLAAQVARGDAAAGEAEHLLALRGAAGAKALADAAADTKRPPEEIRRARLALARLHDPAGAELVAAGLADASADDAPRLVEGLIAMGDAAVAPVARLLAEERAPDAARAHAAKVLAASHTQAARDALVQQCGKGSRPFRQAVLLALGAREAGELELLVRSVKGADPPCEADLWRAATLLSVRAPGDARAALARAAAERLAEPAAAASYELRYRLAQCAAALVAADPAAGAAAARLVVAEHEPALRQVTLEALPRDTAGVKVAITALADADPGVRAAALTLLAAAGAPAAADAPVIHLLATDTWPLVRRGAADVLAGRCAPSTSPEAAANALYTAARADRDETVQRAVLGALVRCREPRAGEQLLAIAADPQLSPTLRAYAASLLGPLGDRTRVPALIKLLDEMRADVTLDPEVATRVAAAAAHSLGDLDDPRATTALADAANDPEDPVVQATAVEAYGKLCPAGARTVLAAAAQSSDSLVVRFARQALQRCKK